MPALRPWHRTTQFAGWRKLHPATKSVICSDLWPSRCLLFFVLWPCAWRIDDIDVALAEHFGLTAEEVDFLTSYDIKIRMGKDSATDEAE